MVRREIARYEALYSASKFHKGIMSTIEAFATRHSALTYYALVFAMSWGRDPRLHPARDESMFRENADRHPTRLPVLMVLSDRGS